MKVTKFDGNTLATSYVATLMGGTSIMLPAVTAMLTTRVGAWPLVSGLDRPGRRLTLGISIEGADVDTLRAQLFRWFDPEDETPKALTVTDDDDSDERYMEVVCEALQPADSGDRVIGTLYVATLAVHGDVRWRTVYAVTPTPWDITASGQSTTLTNGGEDDCYPVYNLKPTAAKTGGYTYKRWVPILWLSNSAAWQYPVVASLDTATLVSASKMQADGDDLRVLVDGIETYRWLDAMNSAATKIWFNLDFVPTQSGTLKTGIANTGTITAIELNEDVTSWPSAGIVLIGTEAFVFVSKDISRGMLTGITRAAKGTSMATHAIGSTVSWIQKDVWILYGNSTVSAPIVSDPLKPAFELDHSTNTSWVYESFGSIEEHGRFLIEVRAGRWLRWGNLTVWGYGGCYTVTQRTSGTPFTVIGAFLGSEAGSRTGWYLTNPCGIVNAVWSNGLSRRASTLYLAHLTYWPRGTTGWYWMYTLPTPASPGGWEAWSYSGAAFAISNTIGMELYFHPSDVEAGDVTVTLNSAETPVVTVNAEQATYTFALTLTNSTTGESITIAGEFGLNQTLQIDTYNKTVVYLADNSSQFQAITLPVRAQWLKLQPGANVIYFYDTGTNAVTLTTTWAKRYY